MRITIEHGDTVAVLEVSDGIRNLPDSGIAALIGEQVGRAAVVVYDVAAIDAAEMEVVGATDVSQLEDASDLYHDLARLADDGNPHHFD